MNELFEIENMLTVLRAGGSILYPTDTIWGIGCDATNAKAVEKIYRIKVREYSKSLIILVQDMEMLSRYVTKVPDVALDLIERITEPLTIIYPNARNLAKNALADDGSVGIRIPGNAYCQALLKAFGGPIVSTSANISGDPNPLTFSQISPKIKDMVDLVVSPEYSEISGAKPSSIIRITLEGDIQIIRS